MIGYLEKVIRPLVLILPKVSGYVKTFKEKNKLMFLNISHEKLFKNCKTIWTKIEDLPVYDDRYIKTKIRAYSDKVYTTFCSLDVPEDGVECKSFTVISIDSLLVNENKYYPQVYFDNCIYKIVITQMVDYLRGNFCESDLI